MSSEVAIEIRGLGKRYELYGKPQDRLKQLLFGAGRTYFRDFWAIHDLDLDVYRGETVGILGVNGSGKTTMLSMICGNLMPTRGTIAVRGRISALLGLGAGFNTEFTGRENIYLNATVLGLTTDEIDERLEDIIEFADIGPFLDQPVKIYSSGMFARLAFAVAINVDPDIFVVDETLSVGDVAFQRKCFARIEDIKRRGATILFVSHATNMILELCNRAVVLHKGEALYVGETKRAVGHYQKLIFAPAGEDAQIAEEIRSDGAGADSAAADAADKPLAPLDANQTDMLDDASTAPESAAPPAAAGLQPGFDPNLTSQSTISYVENGAVIERPCITTRDHEPANTLVSGETYTFRYEVTFKQDCSGVRFFSLLKTIRGVELGGGVYPALIDTGLDMQKGQRVTVSFTFRCRLGAGTYFFNCGVGGEGGQSLHRLIDAVIFRVESTRAGHAFGTVNFDYKPSMKNHGD